MPLCHQVPKYRMKNFYSKYAFSNISWDLQDSAEASTENNNDGKTIVRSILYNFLYLQSGRQNYLLYTLRSQGQKIYLEGRILGLFFLYLTKAYLIYNTNWNKKALKESYGCDISPMKIHAYVQCTIYKIPQLTFFGHKKADL